MEFQEIICTGPIVIETFATSAAMGATSTTLSGGRLAFCNDTHLLYVYNGTTWAVSGKLTFLELNDTPSTYSGAASAFVRVAADEESLEFVEFSAYFTPAFASSKLEDLLDVPAYSGHEGQFLKVSAGEGGTEWGTAGGGGGTGSGESITKTISGASHSFKTGNVVRFDGANYVKAKADTAANAESVGIVKWVDATTFDLVMGGYIAKTDTNNDDLFTAGLSAGCVYFLDNTTDGLLTLLEPTEEGAISKPLFIAISATAGYFFNMRGVEVGGTGTESPLGTISMWGTSTPPAGWLLCDGTEYTANDYLSLYNIIGTTYGSTSAGKFKVPDMRTRVPVGASAGTYTLAATGGEATHRLIEDEMPSHTHTSAIVTSYGRPDAGGAAEYITMDNTGPTGGDAAHNNMQPYLVLNYIIKYQSTAIITPEASIPTGSVITFAGGTSYGADDPPLGYLECDGSLISRTTYASLFTVIGTTYTLTADASGSFRVPNFNGMFLRGRDNGSAVDPNAATRTDINGTVVGAVIGSRQADEFKEHAHDINLFWSALADIAGVSSAYCYGMSNTFVWNTRPIGGLETRPKNAYVMYCIKY